MGNEFTLDFEFEAATVDEARTKIAEIRKAFGDNVLIKVHYVDRREKVFDAFDIWAEKLAAELEKFGGAKNVHKHNG